MLLNNRKPIHTCPRPYWYVCYGTSHGCDFPAHLHRELNSRDWAFWSWCHLQGQCHSCLAMFTSTWEWAVGQQAQAGSGHQEGWLPKACAIKLTPPVQRDVVQRVLARVSSPKVLSQAIHSPADQWACPLTSGSCVGIRGVFPEECSGPCPQRFWFSVWLWGSQIYILAILLGLRITVLDDLKGPFWPPNSMNLSLAGLIDPHALPWPNPKQDKWHTNNHKKNTLFKKNCYWNSASCHTHSYTHTPTNMPSRTQLPL